MAKNEISIEIKDGMRKGLSLQEISFCETYIKTLSLKTASYEALIPPKEAIEILEKPHIKEYIIMRSEQYRLSLIQEQERSNMEREDLEVILNKIILDPATKDDVRLQAINRLNAMKEFDKKIETKSSEELGVEEVKPDLTIEEAEELLKKKLI